MSNKKKILMIFLVIGIGTAGFIAMGYMQNNNAHESKWVWPLERAAERQKLLTFGLYVTPDPEQNPIDPPERFTGYHAALDFETFVHELGQEVSVYAVCNGRVVYRGTAEGYGGVLVQSCRLNSEDVTVLYGHMDPKSFTKKLRSNVLAGERLGILGDDRTSETGGTRKHLHLGIHKGKGVELRGYVQSEGELADYIDPMSVFE